MSEAAAVRASAGPLTAAGAVVAVALVLAGCSSEGPIGAPGGRGGVQLRYVTPQLQVLPTGTSSRVALTLLAREETEDGGTRAMAGERFRVDREEGAGSVSASLVVTDSAGRATVFVETPTGPDRTRVVFILERNRRSHLPFDVVTAPIVPVTIDPGGVAHIDAPAGGALLRFEAGSGEYVLIPHLLDVDRSGVLYRFLHRGETPSPDVVASGAQPPRPAATRPPVVVEDLGHVVAGEIPAGGLVAAATLPGAINIRSCRISVDRLAPLRYVGRHVALYVDAPPGLDQARIDSLGREFDEHIFPTNTEIFGPTTDLDGNGVVIVVMTPELRGVGGVYCDALRTAGVEAFYAVWNPLDPIDRSLATLAHEHQHLVNAGHHQRTRGAIGDERWLNEGMSFAAEVLNGYWGTPLMRMWQFLNGQNGGATMLPFAYAAAFDEEYMMFLLYLGDRFGPDFYHRLGTSGRSGQRNIEHVTGIPFLSLVRDWLVANAASGLPGMDDPRYRYSTVDLHGMAEEIAACACIPKPRFDGMHLEPLPAEGAFDVFRPLDGYDADYYRFAPRADGDPAPYLLYWDAYGLKALRLAAIRLPSTGSADR